MKKCQMKNAPKSNAQQKMTNDKIPNQIMAYDKTPNDKMPINKTLKLPVTQWQNAQ